MSLHLDLFAGEGRRRVSGTSSQRAGLYYERRVSAWFARRFLCVAQPRLDRWYPDLLVFTPSCFECVVVEVKHLYVPRAYAQVERYAALLRRALPWLRVSALVVCAQLDFEFARSASIVPVDQVFNLSRFRENVLILSERELKYGMLGSGPELGGGVAPTVVGQPGGARDSVRSGDGLLGLATSLAG